jgi:23S rRNA pseudouridine1911/1915/1917 synthase
MYEHQKTLPRAGIVHRLDKDTTGLMVAAKSSLAYHSLVNQLSERTVSRKYIAIVDGDVYEDGTVNEPIGRDPNNRIKMAINSSGKEAITNYIPYENYEGFTLIECQLETGRTHQIRVHMQSIKHPLVGDQTYNRPSVKLKELGIEDFPRQALHAYSLAFIHPKTGEEVSFKSDLPEDMYELTVKLADAIQDEDDMDFEYETFEE